MIEHFATLMVLLALMFVCNQLIDIWEEESKLRK